MRTDAAGGGALVGAAALALLCANTPLRRPYASFRDAAGDLVADGVLAVFFYVAGLEVKRELVAGELRERRHALLPVLAAVAGMAVPALVFLAVAAGTPGAGRGWAVPVATDIAFALGVLSLAGPRHPSLRALLLTLAVVDDVGAAVVIAVLFPYGVHVVPLLAVGLALLTPADRAARLERRLAPWSTFVALPLYAFTAAGVSLAAGDLRGALTDRAAVGVFLGLVAGKTLGIAGGVALAERLGLAETPESVAPYDTVCLGVLGGIGFTVSLLLADLAYEGSRAAHVKTAVLAASLVAGVSAAALLRRPSRTSRPRRRAAPRSRP